MSDNYLQLRKILFRGPNAEVNLEFTSGVNVVCGASDTGKSFLAESIDFMLGGSQLRQITELAKYAEIELDLSSSDRECWRFRRLVSGGNFRLIDLNKPNSSETVIKGNHAHGKTDNLSGFLLDKIGLLNKRILKSTAKATTQSLSFRNLARLILIQEEEIQQKSSPFWSGQYSTKTSELATVKLLLTGIDDSSVVSVTEAKPNNNIDQIAFIDELLLDLVTDIEDIGEERKELSAQLERLESSIENCRGSLTLVQSQLDNLVRQRRQVFEERNNIQARLDEISELMARFELLREHYIVDIRRLESIQESSSIFVHIDVVACPLCGASPEAQHFNKACDGDVEAVAVSAVAEIKKIELLLNELNDTITDLNAEERDLRSLLDAKKLAYQELNNSIQKAVVPEIEEFRTSFSELVEKRANVQKAIDLFIKRDKLENRKIQLQEDNDTKEKGEVSVKVGIPDSVAHALSQKISSILKAWHFPGKCHVYFEKESLDFVIDDKPRGARGKGLRAITHAAVSIALFEYCQENGLSHPGFILLDSPLLAYFKPEGEEDLALKKTDLKEMFYDYLVKHHGLNSQILIIENEHPPKNIEKSLSITVFTGNPNNGIFGFL